MTYTYDEVLEIINNKDNFHEYKHLIDTIYLENNIGVYVNTLLNLENKNQKFKLNYISFEEYENFQNTLNEYKIESEKVRKLKLNSSYYKVYSFNEENKEFDLEYNLNNSNSFYFFNIDKDSDIISKIIGYNNRSYFNSYINYINNINFQQAFA